MKPPVLKTMVLTVLFMETIAAQSTQGSFESEIMPIQRQFMAQLTGHPLINDSIKLTNRSSRSERARASNFLYRSLRQFGFTADTHEYRMPNENILVDLLFDPFEGKNIYTVIPATSAGEEFVVLGAHYDTEPDSPGANDNASGLALVYAVAYKLSQLENRHRHFVIVFFDQEEEDEIGSQAFAKKMRNEAKKVHSVHTVDQMGWDADLDRAVELELPTQELESIYRREAEKLSIPIHRTKISSTDHKSFRDLGFDAIGITEEYVNGDTTPHLHKSSDTFETVDFHYLASSTQLVWNVMKRLAQK